MRPLFPASSLLHGDALGQVAGLVHVAAAQQGDVVGQQLQRHRLQERLQVVRGLGDKDDVVGAVQDVGGGLLVPLGGDGDDRAAAGFDLLQVAHHLFEGAAVGDQEDGGGV